MTALALIFHLLDRVSNTTNAANVSLDSTKRAAAWCSFLEAHARRVYGLALNADTQRAKTILKHIRRGDLPDQFTARDIYRKQWAGLAATDAVNDALRLLEDFGWLRSFRIGASDAGGRTSACYLAHQSLRIEERKEDA